MSLHCTWRNDSCLTLTTGDLTIVTNPTNKTRTSASVVLVSNHTEPSHNDVSHIKSATNQPLLVFDTAGEYEVQGALIQGIAMQPHNVGFRIDIDNMRVAFLGRPTHETSLQFLDAFGEIDILLLPIGEGLLDSDTATAHINHIEPRIVIPYGCNPSDDDQSLTTSLAKSMGTELPTAEAKVILKAKSLPVDTTQLILLTPQKG